jgi:hypothetical protein
MVEACLASIESFPVQSLGAEFRHFSEACLCLQVIIQVKLNLITSCFNSRSALIKTS